jgi:uncharacterized protein
MLIVDSGFLVALLDRNDQYHERAIRFVNTYEQGWICTWPVLTEASYLLYRRVHIECALHLMEDVANGIVQIWEMPASHGRSLEKLMRKYRKLPMDLADASLVLLAEHLGSGRILTTDQRDFGAYRWKSKQPFEDVMAML